MNTNEIFCWGDNFIFDNIKEKKIVCFGAGSAAEMFMDVIPKDFTIGYFTDNNSSLWGKNIKGIEIIEPIKIKDIENVYILIVSRHIAPIKEQLMSYGYKSEIDFYDLYSINKNYFQMGKLYESYNKFNDFIETIPDEIRVNKSKEKIGVVLQNNMSSIHVFFPVVFGILLIQAGYNAEFIVDFAGDDESDISVKFSQHLLKNMIDVIQKKIRSIECSYILKGDKQVEFTEEENKQIKKHIDYAIISTLAYMGFESTLKNIDKEKLNIKKYKEVTEHYVALKEHLQGNKYMALCVFNGAEGRKANYTYLGHKFGIRVPSYDVFDWSTDYPCCWNYDIPEIAKSFNDNKREKIYQLVDERLNDRITNNKMLHNRCQVVSYQKDFSQNIEVLIPLNIMFDSAVLGLDDIFDSPEEWIEETVKYLKNETSYNVVIKESPFFISVLNNSSYKELLKPYLDNERIIYYDKDASVNIYNLINNSKVVVPYSSTVGIEAAILGKPVIIHTKSFYRNEGFVKKVTTKQEYFDMRCSCFINMFFCIFL